MKYIFKLCVILATIGTTLAIVLSYLNAVHPAFDTIANFRFHLILIVFSLVIIWLLRRYFRIALALAMVGLYALSTVMSGLPTPQKNATLQTSSKTYSLLHFNVNFANADRNKVLKMILRKDADIFLGVEFSAAWSDVIFGLKSKYPNVFHCPEWRNIGGVYIFSKFPFTDKAAYCHEYAALGVQEVIIEGETVDIGVVHLRWPWPASQPKQLKELKPFLNTLGSNALIAGDFNATTWTHAIHSFAAAGALKVIENIGPTWMEKRLPIQLANWFGLPIDNAMHKGTIQIHSAKTLPPLGSDHLPIEIEFSIKK